MLLTWDEKSNPYEAAEDAIFKRYNNCIESCVVQLRLQYSADKGKRVELLTTLLLNDGEDYYSPKWVWETDWWEGEDIVELIGAVPVADIDLPDEFRF